MTRIERLEQTRDYLANAMDACEIRELPSLTREYRAVLAEIAQLQPAQPEGDGIDEIANRRAARRAGPTKTAGRTKRTS